MRAKTYSFKYALILTPLLAGCPGGGGAGGTVTLPPGGLTLPDCADGQLLTTDSSGKLTCLTVTSGRPNVPGSCGENQALNSDGKNLSCVDKANVTGPHPLDTRITNLIRTADDLTTKANNLSAGGGAAYALYVGNTDQAVKGDIKTATN
ncbi:MAG: hypothetical protein RMK29_21800, partial [Myxococcales bacterium]|nr:hypothetical protein [Myxococcales bacterium]